MALWLMNLAQIGGSSQAEYDQDTIKIEPSQGTIYILTGKPERMEIRYKSPDGVKKQTIDWSDWLGDSLISTVTWDTTPSITVANESNSNTDCTAYFSGGAAHQEIQVDCKIVTQDAIPRTEERSFMLHIVSPKWA